MTISELINKLENIKKEEGDIPVVNYNFENNLIFTIYPKDDFYDSMLIIE